MLGFEDEAKNRLSLSDTSTSIFNFSGGLYRRIDRRSLKLYIRIFEKDWSIEASVRKKSPASHPEI